MAGLLCFKVLLKKKKKIPRKVDSFKKVCGLHFLSPKPTQFSALSLVLTEIAVTYMHDVVVPVVLFREDPKIFIEEAQKEEMPPVLVRSPKLQV